MHDAGYHYIFHSCGKINDFLPYFIELGVDVMNMQQPRAYGIREVGEIARGKIAFLATGDIQTTLPKGDPEEIRAEVRELIENWSTPQGGFIVFNYGDPEALNVDPNTDKIMFAAFAELMYHWQN